MLLTALIAVSSGIVHAQVIPTVTQELPTVTTTRPTVLFAQPFYQQIPLVGDVISFAKRHLTIRYRSGGTTKQGFDCSGFTRFCFSHIGLALPHSSAAQASVGQAVEPVDAQPGDLILFKGHRATESRVGHVGLITDVSNGRIQFIHSAWNGGVRYDYLHADYYQRRFAGIRRVVHLLAGK